jgi:hypothetical protein
MQKNVDFRRIDSPGPRSCIWDFFPVGLGASFHVAAWVPYAPLVIGPRDVT